MKKLATLFSLFILGVCALHASDGSVDRTKKYSKTYSLDPSDKVEIKNSFGDVVIETWNRNEIQVDVSISVSSRSDDHADRMLDAIEIIDRDNGSTVSFRTEIGDMKNKGRNKQQEFEINYEVRMPASQQLELSCEFGEIRMPDYQGALDVTSKFGKLEAGVLSDVDEILVEFGKLDLEAISNGDVVVKFSSANIDDTSGDLDFKFEFSGDVEIGVGAIDHLEIKATNSTVDLELPRNLSATYDIYTNFGSFRNDTDFDIEDEEKEKSFGPDFDSRYRGQSGSGSAEIEIDANFSKIRFEH